MKADLLNGLTAAKDKANARANYRDCMVAMREQGWNDSDVKEYGESIAVLMGDDDEKALSMFPAGTYATASDARQGAAAFWSKNK